MSTPSVDSSQPLGLLERALLTGHHADLEQALLSVPFSTDNTFESALLETFANLIGEMVAQPDPPVEALESLLDGWAALMPEAVSGEVLPCAAVLAYGRVAQVRPDWWRDEIGKLRQAVIPHRMVVPAYVAKAIIGLFASDPARTRAALSEWLAEADNPPLNHFAQDVLVRLD